MKLAEMIRRIEGEDWQKVGNYSQMPAEMEGVVIELVAMVKRGEGGPSMVRLHFRHKVEERQIG